MNIVTLVGNIVRDPEFKTTPQGTSVCDFTIAVQRKVKDASGTYPADFINCTAWRYTADFVHKYFFKGSPIGITGELQTRKYTTKNGDERHITEVIVRDAEFIGRKSKDAEQKTVNTVDDGLEEFVPLDDAELPF